MTQNDSLAYWGLSMFPFDDSRNPQFFFPGSKHKEALTRMIYLVKQGNVHLGMLTGEIGAGKTITSMVLQQQITSPDRMVIYLPNAYAEFKHLLAELIDKLSGGSVEFDTFDEYILTKAFEKVFVKNIVKPKKSLVVMLDEAQSYSHDSLMKIKNLTNLGELEEYPMTFVFIGQPELRKFVKSDDSINQRVAIRYHLEYLNEDEIFNY
ncbi:MAG: AAA family ATPase, partial [Planctomycetes bacterium]|nr:AAA family ATPase [Planctomycetota bacterium]